MILVYDVSRWGRFQDADESAYYEYRCRRAGIQVVYCAEQFENDGSPVSTIVKGVKRAMAGEYTPTCPSLHGRRISPHTLRHTTAMHLLQAGVDLTVIALWLGHESPVTTHGYVEADLSMKERALAAIAPLESQRGRFRASDPLLRFLQAL